MYGRVRQRRCIFPSKSDLASNPNTRTQFIAPSYVLKPKNLEHQPRPFWILHTKLFPCLGLLLRRHLRHHWKKLECHNMPTPKDHICQKRRTRFCCKNFIAAYIWKKTIHGSRKLCQTSHILIQQNIFRQDILNHYPQQKDSLILATVTGLWVN